MNKKCLIVSGGEFCPLEKTSNQFDYIIACDKGFEYCINLGLKPNIVLGDFDSISTDFKEHLTKINDCNDMQIQSFPPEKDDTDTMLAVKTALSKNYNDITILCGFGNRLDHAYANIQTAAYIVQNGGKAKIIGSSDILYAFQNCTQFFPKKDNHSLSVFSYTEKCTNVCISGAKYNLENAELKNTFPLGVSNEWKEEKVQISTGEGILIVIQSLLQKGDTNK